MSVRGLTESNVSAWRRAKTLLFAFLLFEHCAAITRSRDGVLVTATFGSVNLFCNWRLSLLVMETKLLLMCSSYGDWLLLGKLCHGCHQLLLPPPHLWWGHGCPSLPPRKFLQCEMMALVLAPRGFPPNTRLVNYFMDRLHLRSRVAKLLHFCLKITKLFCKVVTSSDCPPLTTCIGLPLTAWANWNVEGAKTWWGNFCTCMYDTCQACTYNLEF